MSNDEGMDWGETVKSYDYKVIIKKEEEYTFEITIKQVSYVPVNDANKIGRCLIEKCNIINDLA